MADHGNKCYVPGCKAGVRTFHTLPSEKKCQQAWLMFIYNRIPQHFNAKLLVCSGHFTTDLFSNLGQYQAGFSQRLTLKKGAVPTISPRASAPQRLRTNDVGCQTDPVVLSIGTRSLNTMSSHLRSKGNVKGTQTTVPSQSVAVGTTTTEIDPFTSAPLKASRPAKRPRVEFEEEIFPISVSSSETDPQARATSMPFHKDAKYIVFENCLLSLFESCPVCSRACDVCPRRRGTFISIAQLCASCGFSRRWRSQPVIGSSPAGDLQLSAAVYFSGASFLNMQKVFRAMHLKTHTYDAFRRHARTYLEPAIIYKWSEEQNLQRRDLSRSKNVILAGDMRADSPGHSAKYGSYTMMDLQTNNIIDIQLVQSSEVGGSRRRMETEGLRRSLDVLEESGVKLDCIVTDRHPHILKFLKDRKINHYYNVWHMVKGLSKKLEKISRAKGCSLVKKWHKSIANHLYWSASGADSGPEKVAKWTSIMNHIQDIHTHSDPAFPRCQHQQRVSKDRSKWFHPGSTALNKLHRVLMNERVLSDVEKLSPHYQTSTVEAFHKVISHFAPKHVVFPFTGRLCRLYLAAMHYNENAVRPQVSTSEGKPLFPQGGHAGKTEPTFCYVMNLMNTVFEEVVCDPLPYLDGVQQIPVPADRSSRHGRPSMEEAVARRVTLQSRV
ncbi:uncharacterized protein LOC120480138 isoform X3 [Pimephales promelas]|uniref:uncharacterized protein LOC120480138 isoform X3 n=1 Tax=Pimephales promelas TaxID=90988 RepID=UPI001955E1DF|nr:uncharacterized protein LOC120480138 isoform X3 [Pimephales promelas]KAG1926991.1 hypothetical protein F2P79_024530 [Pimephales promelas]